jgi:hypothetical protein
MRADIEAGRQSRPMDSGKAQPSNASAFRISIEDLKNDYILRRRKTWQLREHHLAHLTPVFGGMRAQAITTPKL